VVFIKDITCNFMQGSLLTSFPGSSLALMKNKNGGGEPGIDSHMVGAWQAIYQVAG